MYSPRIDESLIPALYLTARSRHMPMTRLVAQLIRKALRTEALPQEAVEALACVDFTGERDCRQLEREP